MSDKGIWERKGGKRNKNPTPKLASELQWAVAVPECLSSQGSLALRFTFQYDFYEECPVPTAVSWVHLLIQELVLLGRYLGIVLVWWWMFLPWPKARSAVPLWFHPWAGLCWGCVGRTRVVHGGSAENRDFPVTGCAWENSCDFITTFCLLSS